MGRTLRLDNANNTFTQGLATNNLEITLFTLGGDDVVNLNRDDDLGGGCTVNTGLGADAVINLRESGNVIRLDDGDDTYVGRGFASFASETGDSVFAGAGNDLIAVETFKSIYRGEAGNDRFLSVGWQNAFVGGAGIDSISYAPRDDDFSLGGSGVTVNLGQGFAETGAINRESLISIENATGSGAGDILIGSSFANRLNGAGGFDDLTGAAGADRFVFARASDSPVSDNGLDLIEDFKRLQGDKLELRLMDANSGATGNQNFTFRGVGAFTNVAGQVRIDRLPDGVLVSGDVNGDGQADFQFGVLGVANLVAGDFIL